MAEDPDKPPQIDANGGSTVTEVPTNGHATPEPAATKAQEPDVDLDAQEMVIASLRTQVQDLFTQVTQLNSKLVNSYDRVSDLEDDLHSASATLKNSNVRISQLEMERTQHLAALNTGLLVEKSHVTTELNRLMEKATEEAAQRGQAESARAAIEKDLDDLSASLFAQANSMVAEARFARHLSEQKVIQSQQALKGAEEAVSIMQTQMQLLQSEKEEAEKKSQEMQAKMGKGKWLERIQSVDFSRPMKLMSSHLPYQEFLLFVAHLRSLHQTSQLPPAMTTILPLPFLARLASEDSEQTLRLDLAPSLNWLSRRSVQSAVHTGQLTIEPISVSTLLSDSTYSSPVTVAGLTNNSDSVPCALCGTPITTVTEYLQARLQRPHTLNQLNNSSWSGSFFKRQSTTSNHGSVSPTQSITATGPISTSSSQSSSQQIYIFRVAPQQTTSLTSSLPIPSSITKSLSQSSTTATSPPHLSPMNGIAHSTSGSGNQPVTIYPLCTSGWCLRRLRSTCTMWAFVRTGIVERVWEEEMPSLPPQISTAVPHSTSTASPSTPGDKPPIPPRKRGLWGFASAIGEKAASWSDPDKKKQHTPSNSVATPPPVPPRRDSGMGRRGLPLTTAPETPPRQPATQAALPPIPTSESNSSAASSPVAPPVPRRSEGRKKSPPTPKALDLQGETSKDETQDEALSTPTNKLLFDADSHQSPLKNDQPLPSVEDVVAAPAAVPTAASPSAVEDKKTEEPEKPLPTKSNPNRFSLARSIPLPDSRPGTPSQAADAALHPPSRTASPATVPVPNGAAPPPVPRRAAARRAVPAPPSRPATPQKPQEEVKSAPEIASDNKADKVDKPAADAAGQIEADNEVKQVKTTDESIKKAGAAGAVEAAAKEEGEDDLQKEKEDLSGDVKEIFEDAQSQLPTPAAVVEGDDQPTLITASSTSESVPVGEGSKNAIEHETPKPSPDKEEAEPIDRSTDSTPDVFLDAVSPPVAKPVLPAAEDVAELPANLPKDRSGAVEASPIPSPLAKIQPTSGHEVINGSGTITSSPLRERNGKEGEDEEEEVTDSSDKEVYIGEATWEERTWKELVRLREEMFWARIGGSR